MNLDKTDFWVFNTGYRLGMTGDILKQIDVAFGLQDIEHLMSNRNKPNRGMFKNETPSSSDAYSGLMKFHMGGGSNLDIIAGIDSVYLARDAVRNRNIVATGQTFKDHIWPDARQLQFGGFAEATWFMRDDLSLRIGGRIDRVESEAKAADSPSLLMNTVRENYVLFYGPEADEVDQDDTVGGGNLLLEWLFADAWPAYVGGTSVHGPPA